MRMHRLALCARVVFGAFSLAQPPQAEPRPSLQPVVDQLKDRLDAWVERTGVPGATLSLAWPDGRTCDVASGLARKEPAEAMTPHHRMMSGSIGKTWVAVTALQLVDEGVLTLDEPISRWIADRAWFKRIPNADDLTLRMLLQHTSGIEEHVMSEDFLAALKADPRKSWTPEETIAFALDDKPLFPAGEGWSYADTNYILAGIVIEAATGRPYNDLARERLLTPLQLADTEPVEGPELPRIASGYAGPQDPFAPSTEVAANGVFAFNPQFEWTGGGMVTTSHDLAAWACRMFAGEVVPEDLRDDMLDGVAARTGPGDKYGLGVQIMQTPYGTAYGHSGFFPGYLSMMLYFPDLGVAAAVQVNTTDFAKAKGMRPLLFEAAGTAELVTR